MSWYNEEIKKEFINQYSGIVGENTFNHIFTKSAEMEFALDKDCSLFNIEEILDLARSFKSSDVASLRVKNSLLRSYTKFCIEKGLSNTGLNHYNDLTTKMYDGVVDKRKLLETYISREEIEEIIMMFDNARDQYLVLAPYEGIYGVGLCEMLEARKGDLLGNNQVRLCTGRTVTVSDLLYAIMEESADCYEVSYSNRKVKLHNTDKIYKGLDRKSIGDAEDTHIKRKYWRLRNMIGRRTFGARMLYVSGFINEIDKAIAEYGSFEEARSAIEEIRKRFNSSYSTARIKAMYKEFLMAKEQ